MTDTDAPPIEPAEPGAIHLAHDLVTTHLGDLGDKLCHGLLTESGPRLGYRFHPPTMGTRKRLGALRTNRQLMQRPGVFGAHWLAVALAELGDEPLPEDRGKAAMAVAALTAGDFMLLLFAWQRMTQPGGLPVAASGCGTCGAEFDRVLADLAGMEITALPPTATTADPPLARVGLRRGFLHRGKLARTVQLRPPTWLGTYYRLGRSQFGNPEIVHAAMLRDSILRSDVADGRPSVEELDELWPEDVSLLDDAMGKITPTPDLQIRIDCPVCEAPNQAVLDWTQAFATGG